MPNKTSISSQPCGILPSLVLGTAQLGMVYGVANRRGQPDLASARAIVHTAWESGIREFDTAPSYGVSEDILGRVLSELGIAHEARIISKLHPDLDHTNKEAVRSAVDQSLNRLKVNRLKGLLIHREEFLDLLAKGMGNILHGLVEDGRVDQIGVSVYTPDRALQALQSGFIDLVQTPANLLDHRFLQADVFRIAEEKGKSVYIRSIFLQGLILMKPEQLPDRLNFARPVLEKLNQLCHAFNMNRQEMAIGYVKSKYPTAHVIFGAETPDQVKINSAIWLKTLPEDVLKQIDEHFFSVDPRVINPTLWGS
jgi:aryl-alcohol dehydrogenase-like predicted oxidoreductase